jgi:hypothetical protein
LGIELRRSSPSPELLLEPVEELVDDDCEPERLALLPERDELLPGNDGGEDAEGNDAVDGMLDPVDPLLGMAGAELPAGEEDDGEEEGDDEEEEEDGDDDDADGIDGLELLLEEELCCSKQPLSDKLKQAVNSKGRTLGRKRPCASITCAFVGMDVTFLR